MSQPDAAPFRIAEIVVTKAQLARLPKAHREFVLAASAAANDIGLSWRLMIMASNNAKDPLADVMVKQIYLRIARRLIAEVVEYRHVIKRFHRKIERRPECKTLASMCVELLTKDHNEALLKHATEVRHEITNHYQGPVLDIHFARFADDHPFTMYLHDMTGNSAYLFAEEVATFGQIRKNPTRDLDSLIKWAHEFSRRSITFHGEALARILEEFIPEMVAEERVIPMERRFMFDRNTALPIFYQPSVKVERE